MSVYFISWQKSGQLTSPLARSVRLELSSARATPGLVTASSSLAPRISIWNPVQGAGSCPPAQSFLTLVVPQEEKNKKKEKENQGQKLRRERKSAIDRGRKQTETKEDELHVTARAMTIYQGYGLHTVLGFGCKGKEKAMLETQIPCANTISKSEEEKMMKMKKQSE
ncbi:predicted protein [Histoplasma capsulatum G186AR]|uniref:Uncharacterized protein n=1 Tax=Ajellomyces capsulatus (strain G186AR / H82 / ATCC MYA-2454 / RMSCC 2432) TaxID=447093 RepID=C0NP59_AJECG|nr:uncharacterized protein HCBG_04939 [Histoplasma capsulatum G186AR]EEH06719.1 predicted protein [Histoplasma capsulatum G186AR]